MFPLTAFIRKSQNRRYDHIFEFAWSLPTLTSKPLLLTKFLPDLFKVFTGLQVAELCANLKLEAGDRPLLIMIDQVRFAPDHESLRKRYAPQVVSS